MYVYIRSVYADSCSFSLIYNTATRIGRQGASENKIDEIFEREIYNVRIVPKTISKTISSIRELDQ